MKILRQLIVISTLNNVLSLPNLPYHNSQLSLSLISSEYSNNPTTDSTLDNQLHDHPLHDPVGNPAVNYTPNPATLDGRSTADERTTLDGKSSVSSTSSTSSRFKSLKPRVLSSIFLILLPPLYHKMTTKLGNGPLGLYVLFVGIQVKAVHEVSCTFLGHI